MAKENYAADSVSRLVEAADGESAAGESLGGYSQLFPALGQALETAGANAEAAAFAEARAVTFGLAASSFRVRGVIIGQKMAGDPLDATDIRWSILPSKQVGQATQVTIDLRLADASTAVPAWRNVGSFDAGVLNQALRYAADRRVVATTIVAGDGKTLERETALHPALSDTALGCRIIEVDRVIDTFSQAPSTSLAQFASDRDNMTKWLQVARWSEVATQEKTCPIKELSRVVSEHHFTPVRFSPTLRQSLDDFISERGRASPESDALLRRADRCATGPTDQLPACICKASVDGHLPSRYWFPEDHTSQVRERPASLTLDLAWLQPSPSRLENFEFATHTTFAIHDVVRHDTEDSTATTLSFPSAELATLREEIARRLPTYVASQLKAPSYDDFIRPIEEFVLAQRLARAALDGQLGSDFPLSKLIALQKVTRPYVNTQPTLRWEPVDHAAFLISLQQRNADAAKLYRSYFEDFKQRVEGGKQICGPVSK
jgi:hypothetical protein